MKYLLPFNDLRMKPVDSIFVQTTYEIKGSQKVKIGKEVIYKL
jgi:hypothetical protein